MQIEINEWVTLFRAGVGIVPPALIAVFLLAGPTVGWLLYRYIVQPRARRMRSLELSAMWVCSRCRSVNELRMSRCYRCDARPDEEELELIDTHPVGPARLAAVGPGLDLGGPGRSVGRGRSFDQGARSESSGAPHLTGMPYLAVVPDLEVEPDTLTLPDVAAMTEVAEAPRRHRTTTAPGSIAVGPGKPEIAPPRRVAVAGKSPDPDDSPAA